MSAIRHLRMSIRKCRLISRGERLLILSAPDDDLLALDRACRTMSDATAAAIMAELPPGFSRRRFCAFIRFAGRRKGEGRRLPRPNRTGPRERDQDPAAADAIPERILRLLQQEPLDRQVMAIASWHKLLRAEPQP